MIAEVEWAIERKRPIVAVRLDGSDWMDVIRLIRPDVRVIPAVPIFTLTDGFAAQEGLREYLTAVLARYPQYGTS